MTSTSQEASSMRLSGAKLRMVGILLGVFLALQSSDRSPDSGLLAQEPESTPTDNAREPLPGMDRFDLRAAEEPSRTEKLSLAQKSFERLRWDEGVQQLQNLLNEDQDSLVYGGDRVWRPVSRAVYELTRSSPNEAREAYDARYAAIANRELTQARKTRDLPALLLIARRYLLTNAGQQASREVIDAAIDQGNCESVAMLVADLLRINSPLLQDVQWRAQLVEILREAGFSSLTKQLNGLAGSSSEQASIDETWGSSHFGQPQALVTDWYTLSGSPVGQAIAKNVESTLLPRWRTPLVSSPRVRRIVEDLGYDIEDQGGMGLSVLSTVGVGKILVTRTLSNLTAVNIDSGKVLWTSREWGVMSPDGDADLLESEHRIEVSLENNAEDALSYRVRNRLTACGSLGMLSANSRFVFSLASFSSSESQLESMVQPGFEESEQSDNYLYARDLNTGRIVWRAGGPISEVPPGLPAAGVTFFGPPTPDGDELLGVGERDGDILLFCLEAETGIVRWEQLLAAAGRRLTEDSVRRSWTAPVAIRGSLAVCPTTTGWVTAVDRISRRIVWSQRVIDRSVQSSDQPGFDVAFNAPNRDVGLEERWPPLQPILLRDRVIIAPIELPDESGAALSRLLCFDLVTGNKIWETPKHDSIGVIGATDELVYLFDRLTVRAYRCDTGVQTWKCTSLQAPIAGRPLLTSNGICVPTAPYSMVVLEPTRGKVIDTLQVGDLDVANSRLSQFISAGYPGELSLGNLISLNGRLVSVSPCEMVAFEWTSDEPQWQAAARADGEAALLWSKSLALRGELGLAVQTLREVIPQVADKSPLSAQARQSLTSLLLLRAESQLRETKPDAEWRSWLIEAGSMATSEEDRESIQRLQIELELLSGDWDAAWGQIRNVIRHPLILRIKDDRRVVHADAWLADQIRLLSQIPDRTQGDAMRSSLRTEFLALWKEAAQNRVDQRRLLQLFAETPFADQSELETLSGSDEPARISRLLALVGSRDRNTALQASVELIEQLATPDWVGEARRRLAELPDAENWPKQVSRTRIELEQRLAPIVDSHRQPPASWLGAKLEVTRHLETESGGVADLQLIWIGHPCEALENFDYYFDHFSQSVVIDRLDGKRYGEIPLSSGSEFSDSPTSPVLYACGLNIYLMHSGILHAFSVPDKRLLWKKSGYQSSEAYSQTAIQMNKSASLERPAVLQDRQGSYAYRSPMTTFEVANARQLVVRSRRGIEVLCTQSGQLIWELPNCPTETVRCDGDRLYRLGSNRVIAYSIRSGRLLSVPRMSEFGDRLSPLDPVGITTLSEQPGDVPTWVFEGYQVRGGTIPGRSDTDRDLWDEGDQLQFEPVWKLPVSSQSRIGAGPPGQGVWLDDQGDVKLIHWATGRTQALGMIGPVPAGENQAEGDQLQVGCDWDRFHVYLLTSSSAERKILDCPAIPVAGHAFALSRERSALQWKHSFQGHLLTNSQAYTSFVALLNLEDSQVAGYPYQKIQLVLLDKQTGQVAFELNTKSFNIGVIDCLFDQTTQSWDLFLQGENITIRKLPDSAP